MSSETLSYFFKNEDIKLKARFQVALQCAPFLKGIKISSVITMEHAVLLGVLVVVHVVQQPHDPP